MDKILDLIESGRKNGAKLLTGGQRHGDQGFFVQPTVFGDVQDDHRISREEVKKKIDPHSFFIVFLSLKRSSDLLCKFSNLNPLTK